MAVDGAPLLEIRYDDLRLSAYLSASAHARSFVTVAETLWGAATALPRALFTRPPPPKELHILNGCSGVIRSGTMTLLLGCPGAGKSSLLKALTGRLPNPSALRGTVTYSGLDAKGLRAAGFELGQLVQLVSQLDEHFPFLTVRETLSFVAKNIMPAGEDAKSVSARVDEVCSLLHLNSCIDTIIGDELARGVSGGEKKRVTIGEGIITAARFLALDEISTGLDSSVTYDVVKSLRARARDHGLSVVIALLQPTPETVALFDDIILLREGAVVYHGARESLPGYLSGLGFHVPTASAGEEGAEDLADYLAELITFPKRRHEKDLARVAALADAAEPLVGLPLSPSSGTLDDAASGAELPTKSQPPLTTEEMVAAWQAAPLRKVNLGEGAAPAAPPTLTTAAAKAQYGQPYVHSGAVHALSLLHRQWRLLTANKLFMFMRIFSALFMAILFGGLYYQGDVNDGLNKYGLFLNCVMQLLFTNISEMSGAVEGKYIAYRQVANSVHPAWAFPLASILAHIPVALIESLCFGGIAYFMCGLTYDAGRFFFFTLTIFLIDVYAATLFRLFAFAAPNLVAAQAGPMPIIALLIMFSGFMVARSKMGWLEFIFWCNPAGWAIQSLAQNEFYASRYAYFPTIGTVTSTSTLGKSYLSLMDMQLDATYQWMGILFVVAMTVLVASAQFAAFAFIRYDRNTGSARVSEDNSPKDSVRVVLRADSSTNVLAQSASSGSIVVRDPSLGSIPSAPTTARSVLPFAPLALAWKDLSYTVKLSKQAGGGERTLLHGVTGYALPGRLIALMGASGAGKTTLLDVLSGRKNTGKQTGQIFLNGFLKDARTFNRSASYCEQNDLHMPLTTVREAIAFSAELRLPSTVTADQRAQFVLEILEILELSHCADAKVGNPGSPDGLAPGERKRLTIGVELAANSPIIFLDEPTSGLDARAAAVVVRVVRNIASTGRTIICTVHQPSAEVFGMFDDLLLLQRGGWQTYFGPCGKRSATLLNYIGALPGAPPCAPGFNPSSYMLDVLAGTDSSGSKDTASAKNAALNGEVLQQTYFASTAWTAKAAGVHESLCTPAPGAVPIAFASSQARSFAHQVYTLTRRTWKMYARNINMNVGRISAIIFLCTLFGTIYFNLANRAGDYQGMRTLVAAIFMTAAFSAMLNMDASLPTLIANRSSFYREQSALMYASGAYVISNFLVELPWLAAIVLAGTSIGYFMIGLKASAVIFFTHYFATYILALVLVSFGNAVAATMPSFDTGQAVVGIFAPILFLFGGLFSKPSSMPPGSKWINTIDPIGYAFRALIPLHFDCQGGTAAGCPTITVFEVSVDRSDFVSSTYEVAVSQIWPSIGYMAIFIAVFQALNVFSTYRVRHLSR